MIGGLVHLLCLLSLSGKHPAVESCTIFPLRFQKGHTAQVGNPPLGHESVAVAEWDNRTVIWCQPPSPVRQQHESGLGIFPLIPLESSNLYGQGRGEVVPLAV